MEEYLANDDSGSIPAGGLDGRWRVERLGGLLPPMPGVSKEIHGGRGKTRFGSLLSLPFRVERRADCIALVYSPPLSALVDKLTVGSGDSLAGRAVLGGYELGRFRMVRIQQQPGRYRQPSGGERG